MPPDLSMMDKIETLMHRMGATRVIFKLLANNDNSKNQIYLGGSFDLLRMIKHGDLIADKKASKKKDVMYKASLNLHWVTSDGTSSKAAGTQLILYPKYPEVRMSGFCRGCSLAPSHLLREPTPEEREARLGTQRCMILGLCDDDRILAHVDHWQGSISQAAKWLIESKNAINVSSVFFERTSMEHRNRKLLINRLREIYYLGFISSRRLDSDGKVIPYRARNGAGYTLESLFEITPNGRPGPDHLGWELKSHSSGPVTLMTPEPDTGTYQSDIGVFLESYGRRKNERRRDFTGRHNVGKRNDTTGLTLRLEGLDATGLFIIEPSGGLILRNDAGEIAAGWTFDKLLTHWSNKHARTAYVPYSMMDKEGIRYYTYGPSIRLCQGAALPLFFSALMNSAIYYDPGIKIEFTNNKWKSKKRNQFRIAWKNINHLYESVINERLDDQIVAW